MHKRPLEAPVTTAVPIQKFKVIDLFGLNLSANVPISPRTREFLAPYYDIVQDEGRIGLVKKGPELNEATVKAFLARRGQGHRRNAMPLVFPTQAYYSSSHSDAYSSLKPPGK